MERLEEDIFLVSNQPLTPPKPSTFHPSTPSTSQSTPPSTAHRQLSTCNNSPLQFSGKLFNTYLIVQSGADAFFIDQHAAHERLLYDRFLAEIDRGEPAVQELLIPYTFTVSPEETEFLEELLNGLSKLGFTIMPNDRAGLGKGVLAKREETVPLMGSERGFSISAVPAALSGIRFNDFVAELLENPHASLKKSDFLKERIAQAACKAAVKGGDDLSESEIAALLEQMRAAGSVPLCPHGRPTVVKISKLDIEKWFRRI